MSLRDSLRAQDWNCLGRPSAGNGLRVWNDLLAAAARLECGGRLATPARNIAGGAAQGRAVGDGGGDRRCLISPRFFGGADTGPSPVDRAKTGCKHHLLVDLHGVPLVAKVTKANEDDRRQMIPMVDAMPVVGGKIGAPQRKPKYFLADRGYDSEPHRDQLRHRGIEPVIPRRNTGHGSGLGKFRWVVERTISWLHQFRRLRSRWERDPAIHEAFLKLGCGMICHRMLHTEFC
jgi:transposase